MDSFYGHFVCNNFLTDCRVVYHYPRYPLPCEFGQNALSDISHLKRSLLRNFKILDSALKVVMNTTHVTVLFVFFCSATPQSSALGRIYGRRIFYQSLVFIGKILRQ